LSDVGAMVGKLIAAGCAPDVAAAVVAEVFTAGVLSAPVRGQSVDETTEKRRERDRIRQALKRAEAKKSADNPPTSAESADCPTEALSLKIIKKEDKKERARKHPCPADWQPKERHFAWAEKENIPRSAVLSKAEDMRLWAQSTGEQKKDWDATLEVWLRRDAPKLRVVKPTVSGVQIKAGDRSWDLWKAHYRDIGQQKTAALMDSQAQRGGAITVPSEYPPGHERAA
jgi:hypothetical protein